MHILALYTNIANYQKYDKIRHLLYDRTISSEACNEPYHLANSHSRSLSIASNIEFSQFGGGGLRVRPFAHSSQISFAISAN